MTTPPIPPLWLTLTCAVTTIIINITMLRCRKTLDKRQVEKQEHKTRIKDVTYWTYTIVSSMANAINAIALTLLAWFIAVGMSSLHANRIYIFMIVIYAIIGCGSLFATHKFFIEPRYTPPDSSDLLIDPRDQMIIQHIIVWMLFNIITDIVLWMLMVSIPEPIRQLFS